MKKAKNRVLFIWLAIMLALTLGLAGCALSQEEPQITSESLTAGVMTESDNSSSNIEDQIQATNRYQALLDRACAIYQESTGVVIDSEQLKNALEQAQGELLEEALETRLQNLVDDGKMTQEEAEIYLEWWQSRPDIEVPLPGSGRPGPGVYMAGRLIAAVDDSASGTEDQAAPFDRYQALLDKASAIYQENTGMAIDSEQFKNALDQAQSELQGEALERRLQNLVADGKMTQEEAEIYLEWWQSRPDIGLPLPGFGGPSPRHGMIWDRGFEPWSGPGPSPGVSD